MAIKQLSVFLENKQGQLSEAVKLIADAGIDIRALSIGEANDFGILRLIVSDTNKAKNVLGETTICKTNDVIAVKMEDNAGALCKVLSVFDEAKINVDYSYAFTSKDMGAYVVFRVDDVALGEKVLLEKGVTLICKDDI